MTAKTAKKRVPSKKPVKAELPPVYAAKLVQVWLLWGPDQGLEALAGVFSTPQKGQTAAGQAIRAVAGNDVVAFVGTMWTVLAAGELELVYGRDDRSWHYVLEAYPVDEAS